MELNEQQVCFEELHTRRREKNTTRFQWVLDTTMCSSSNTRISVIVIKDGLRLALGEISSSIFLCFFGVFLKFCTSKIEVRKEFWALALALKHLGHHN